jgi:hypothetical protein
VDVVGLLPGGELGAQVDVVRVREQRVELELVGEVRALDLAVEVGSARPDVDVVDALVFDMRMDLGLELMPIVKYAPMVQDPAQERGRRSYSSVVCSRWVGNHRGGTP